MIKIKYYCDKIIYKVNIKSCRKGLGKKNRGNEREKEKTRENEK